jgi:EmrB/QacA subfamily drug resistance transporter
MDRSTQRIILIATAMIGFVATFMASSINIALPLIESEFRVSAVTLGWISTTYVLSAGAVLMAVGRLADLYGRMRVYLIGLAGFTILSFASALAPSATVLIVLRVFQGLASALLFATHTALVILSHPPEVRGRALGVQVAGVYLGLTLGPVLGGIISRNAGWRTLFVVVGALSLANCILPFWKLRKIDWREPKTARFDILGSVIWAIALSALLLGFTYLPDTLGGLLITAGIVGLALFFWWETRAGDPILSVDLFLHNRVFALSNTASLINYSATFAMTFLMSLYLQYNRGLDAQAAGLILVPGLLVQAGLSVLAGRLADRLPARMLASTGMGLTVLGLFAFVFLGETTPYWYIVGVLCVLGIGLALFASPMTHTVMGSVEKRHVGVASATLATMRVTGQNLSMGIATLVLAIVIGRHKMGPVDYPHFLTSARISFAIFAALCVLGFAASLVKPVNRQHGDPTPPTSGPGPTPASGGDH